MKRLLLAFVVWAAVGYSGNYQSGQATCPTSGNAQVSTTSYSLRQLTVSALAANTGKIYVGGIGVTTSTGGELVAGASYNSTDPANSINPATLYFACTVNTDGVAWIGRE